MTVIRIAAVVIENPYGKILSVRKRGTTALMLPGGKIEPGEKPIQTATREIFEEIGLDLPLSELTHLDTLTAPAANEPGASVCCDVFIWSGVLDHLPSVRAEIDEACWCDVSSTSLELAPLSREVVFPRLRGKRG